MRCRIFPPFIDAYFDADWGMDVIEKKLVEHANQWAEQSVGAGALRGLEAKVGDKFVICCARISDAENDLLCLATVGPDWWLGPFEVVAGPIDDEWDVT